MPPAAAPGARTSGACPVLRSSAELLWVPTTELWKTEKFLFKFKGYNFIHSEIDVDFLENLDDFEMRDDDVLIITYPKSEYHKRMANVETVDQLPFLEYNVAGRHFDKRPSPRLFCSHLPYYLAPRGLKNKKAKVIYVYRNPKDVLCSSFHFSNMMRAREPSSNMDEIIEHFLEGKVYGSLWFDNIKGWYEQKSHFNIQFIMYEDMIKDLRSAILKVCKFLGKEMSEEDMDVAVRQATLEIMKSDPLANFENALKAQPL
ncbi:hypothetical protein MC885_003103 [Smutsia gigantea]|nr:hypothetical protein MC885_003103 [Smutsia gigantea]